MKLFVSTTTSAAAAAAAAAVIYQHQCLRVAVVSQLCHDANRTLRLTVQMLTSTASVVKPHSPHPEVPGV